MLFTADVTQKWLYESVRKLPKEVFARSEATKQSRILSRIREVRLLRYARNDTRNDFSDRFVDESHYKIRKITYPRVKTRGYFIENSTKLRLSLDNG